MATDYIYDPRLGNPIAPGEHIREILEERGISQIDFATRLGRSEKFVSQLINGKATLSHDTAIELERVLGVPANFWNNCESIYRDVLARIRREEESAAEADWADSFPLGNMASRGWIARESTLAEQATELYGFFGVSSVDAYGHYWSSDRRLATPAHNLREPRNAATIAWLRAGERAAELIQTEPFSDRGFRSALAQMRSATRLPIDESLPLVADSCASAGVAVAFIASLPKARMSEAGWWATRTRAVIAVAAGYKTADQLWFALYRQAGYLLLGDRSRSGISGLSENRALAARANTFAADLLVPPADYERLLVQPGRLTKARVTALADEIGVAPGIVVARLQHDGHLAPTAMNDLKARLECA